MPLLRIFKKQHNTQDKSTDVITEIEELLNKEIKTSRDNNIVITIPLKNPYFTKITNKFEQYRKTYYTTLHNIFFDYKHYITLIKNIRKIIEQEILIIAEALQPELKKKAGIKEVIYDPRNDTIEVVFSIKIKLK